MKFKTLFFPALAMGAIVLLSNILVQFTINDWLTWGAFSYPVAYLVTDVCNRILGPSAARRIVLVGFVVGLASSTVLASLQITLASGSAFLVSQLLDVSVFNRLRQRSWWQAPFIGSCLASVIDTAIFFKIAFADSELNWLSLAAGDLSVKLIMAALLLPAYRAVIRKCGLLPAPKSA